MSFPFLGWDVGWVIIIFSLINRGTYSKVGVSRHKEAELWHHRPTWSCVNQYEKEKKIYAFKLLWADKSQRYFEYIWTWFLVTRSSIHTRVNKNEPSWGWGVEESKGTCGIIDTMALRKGLEFKKKGLYWSYHVLLKLKTKATRIGET